MPVAVNKAIVLPFLASIAMLTSCGEVQDEKVLTLAHGLDEGHTVHRAMVLMGERLEEYSDGQERIANNTGSQLVSERETLELLHIGSQAKKKL